MRRVLTYNKEEWLKDKFNMQNQRGMTLVEMVVAIGISGIVVVASLQTMKNLTKVERRGETRYAIRETLGTITRVLKNPDACVSTFAPLTVQVNEDVVIKSSGASGTAVNLYAGGDQLDRFFDGPALASISVIRISHLENQGPAFDGKQNKRGRLLVQFQRKDSKNDTNVVTTTHELGFNAVVDSSSGTPTFVSCRSNEREQVVRMCAYLGGQYAGGACKNLHLTGGLNVQGNFNTNDYLNLKGNLNVNGNLSLCQGAACTRDLDNFLAFSSSAGSGVLKANSLNVAGNISRVEKFVITKASGTSSVNAKVQARQLCAESTPASPTNAPKCRNFSNTTPCGNDQMATGLRVDGSVVCTTIPIMVVYI